MIDADTRGIGGQRKALLAFFALTSAAIAVVIAMKVPDRREAGPATTTPVASMPTANTESLAQATTRNSQTPQQQVLEIERALVSTDVRQRESALYVLLPELLGTDPARVVELVARQTGEARDALRDEVVRLWIVKDREAALVWMGSFEDEQERNASATIAMRTLAAIDPAQAIAVADEFGIGRDDGSLEHVVQIWATEDFDACVKWLETQPDNPHTAQLRTRVEQVREQQLSGR